MNPQSSTRKVNQRESVRVPVPILSNLAAETQPGVVRVFKGLQVLVLVRTTTHGTWHYRGTKTDTPEQLGILATPISFAIRDYGTWNVGLKLSAEQFVFMMLTKYYHHLFSPKVLIHLLRHRRMLLCAVVGCIVASVTVLLCNVP